jgi:hypothetical protein
VLSLLFYLIFLKLLILFPCQASENIQTRMWSLHNLDFTTYMQFLWLWIYGPWWERIGCRKLCILRCLLCTMRNVASILSSTFCMSVFLHEIVSTHKCLWSLLSDLCALGMSKILICKSFLNEYLTVFDRKESCL